jgi:iron complex transport system substrate-binding protein
LPRVTASAVDPNAPSAEIDVAVREIASSGRALYALNETLIERLAPDLIITQSLCEVCAVSESAVRRLAARLPGAPRVVSLGGGTIDAVLDDIATVGRETGLADEAEELVLGLRRRMRTVHETLKAARAPRPRVAVLEWTDPLFSGGHWVPEQVRRAGGADALALPGEHSRVVTHAQLQDADAEIVLVAPCGFGVERAAAEARSTIAAIPSLRDRQVWAVDANALTSRPGPGIVTGIEAMARIFAPGLFSPIGESVARRVR